MKVHFLLYIAVSLAGLSRGTSNNLQKTGLDGGSEIVIKRFKSFIKKYKKVYVNKAEFYKRLEIFAENLEKVKSVQEREEGTAQYGVTKYSDLTRYEFKTLLGSSITEEYDEPPERTSVPHYSIPRSLDWRKNHVVTPVESQGTCASSWAFSAVGNVESLWAIKKGKLTPLTKQQLLDCDLGDSGCKGGTAIKALQYILDTKGLESESEYPYLGESRICAFNRSSIVAKISSYKILTKDEKKIARWLYKKGPVAARLNIKPLLHYQKGILHPKPSDCYSHDLNYEGLIVGYGSETHKNRTIPFWIVKTSFGKNWGENGYFRIHRGDGTCGINNYVSTAIISE